MPPQHTWAPILKRIAAVLIFAVSAYALYFITKPATRPDSPAAIPAPGRTDAKAAKPPGEDIPTRMQPGETRPGTSTETVIVQPFQPGPPKEISSKYRVPTHREDARITRTADGRIIFEQAIDLARRLHDKDLPAEEDIQILDAILGYYRMMYKSNPVAGENFEVISSLMGKNKQGVVVFPMDHPNLDGEGNLLDRWGTPYFFHAISATLLDIQSAGPDRLRGSRDDLKLGYELPESD